MTTRDHKLILTTSSKKRLEDELRQLRTVKRAEVTEALRKARSYGDLSENFEYHAARQQQAILNGKIADLEAMLEKADVVEDAAGTGETVGIGAVVTVRDLDTLDEWDFTLVDASSADPHNDRISCSSPVGKALMDRRVGDEVEVSTPSGKARYELIALRYE